MRRSTRDLSSGFAAHAFPFQIGVHSILNSKEKVLVLSRKLKAGAVGVVAAAVLFGGGVSSALAVPSPALWSSSSGAKFVGTLTVTGGGTTTCSFLSTNNGFAANNTGTPAQAKIISPNVNDAGCATGNGIKLGLNAKGFKDGAARSLTNTAYTITVRSPFVPIWGTELPAGAWTVPFINGNASTPSQVVFNNTPLDVGGSIRATGTLNVVNGVGGLLTLN